MNIHRESEEEKMAQSNWEVCLDNYTSMACSVPKENGEQRKVCEQARSCIEKGYDEPLSANLLDAFGGTLRETAGMATFIAVVSFFALR